MFIGLTATSPPVCCHVHTILVVERLQQGDLAYCTLVQRVIGYITHPQAHLAAPKAKVTGFDSLRGTACL